MFCKSDCENPYQYSSVSSRDSRLSVAAPYPTIGVCLLVLHDDAADVPVGNQHFMVRVRYRVSAPCSNTSLMSLKTDS